MAQSFCHSIHSLVEIGKLTTSLKDFFVETLSAAKLCQYVSRKKDENIGATCIVSSERRYPAFVLCSEKRFSLGIFYTSSQLCDVIFPMQLKRYRRCQKVER